MIMQITGYVSESSLQYIETTSMQRGLPVRTLTSWKGKWYLVAFNHNKKHPCPDFVAWAKRQDAAYRRSL